MTFIGFIWLLAWLVLAYLMFRWVWKIATEDFQRSQARLRGTAPEVAEPTPLVPPGWTVEAFAADGLRSLEIMLIQHDRRSRS